MSCCREGTHCRTLMAVYVETPTAFPVLFFFCLVLRLFHVSLFNFLLVFSNSFHCMASIGGFYKF